MGLHSLHWMQGKVGAPLVMKLRLELVHPILQREFISVPPTGHLLLASHTLRPLPLQLVVYLLVAVGPILWESALKVVGVGVVLGVRLETAWVLAPRLLTSPAHLGAKVHGGHAGVAVWGWEVEFGPAPRPRPRPRPRPHEGPTHIPVLLWRDGEVEAGGARREGPPKARRGRRGGIEGRSSRPRKEQYLTLKVGGREGQGGEMEVWPPTDTWSRVWIQIHFWWWSRVNGAIENGG